MSGRPQQTKRWQTHRCIRWWFGWLLVAGLATPGSRAETELRTPAHYEVAAGFLYNFCKLTDWPDARVPAEGQPWVMAVQGENRFGESLAKLSVAHTCAGRPVAVRHFKTPADIGACHILFIARGPPAEIAAALAKARGAGVLTVGVTADFLKQGGMIRLFVDEEGRVRFEVNAATARQEGLRFSSKLLRIAKLAAATGWARQ